MKSFLLFFVLFSTHLFAGDSIIIDIGGVRHQCTPINTGNPTECFNAAYGGPFSRDEAMTLCRGAYSDAPAQCGILAYRGRFSKEQSINLCIGSTTNTGPIDCANVAYSGPFSVEESLKLCSHNGTERMAVCALEAYRGPYSKEEAIEMCRNPYFSEEEKLNSVNKIKVKNISKQELNAIIDDANSKAIQRKEYK
jgi:hypothetical protein